MISSFMSTSFRNSHIFFTVTLGANKEQSLCSLLFQVLLTSNALATFHSIVYQVKRFRLLCFQVNSFSHREAQWSTEKVNPISIFFQFAVRQVLCQNSFESNSCGISSYRNKGFQVFLRKNVLLLINFSLNIIPQTVAAQGDMSRLPYILNNWRS